MCLCVYVFMCLCVYVFMCLCVYVFGTILVGRVLMLLSSTFLYLQYLYINIPTDFLEYADTSAFSV